MSHLVLPTVFDVSSTTFFKCKYGGCSFSEVLDGTQIVSFEFVRFKFIDMKRSLLIFTRSICDKGGRLVRWSWVTVLLRIIVGKGPIALAVGACWGCLDIFFFSSIFSIFYFSSIFSLFFLPPWEMVRYRLKDCLSWPLNPN